MVLFLKLLICHLLVDFIFQSDKSVRAKEKHGYTSIKLYLHAALHGLLTVAVLYNQLSFIYMALLIAVSHFIIDAVKIEMTTKKNARVLFVLDQLAHVIILGMVAYTIQRPDLSIGFDVQNYLIALLACVLFLTTPVGIMLKLFFTRWKDSIDDSGVNALKDAGKWIGMLERLFVFTFVITDHWEAVGFLITAKSVFRFGDLSKAKNMKLTEYVLIGTLLSFGIAILTGVVFKTLLT